MSKARAKRALERQLAYQEAKSRELRGDRREIDRSLTSYAQGIAARIERHGPIPPDGRILEVGSGAHGVVFFLGLPGAVGVDPLAADYARLFPWWQSRVPTVAAGGESLPFADGSFDVVISDYVVDHAESPRQIVRELVRVLAPGGVLYFSVHVHHPIYGVASFIYGAARACGLPLEIGPFADHTFHLTSGQARRLFAGLGLKVAHQEAGIEQARADAQRSPPRHWGDRLKRVLFKNARFELIARKPVDTGHR